MHPYYGLRKLHYTVKQQGFKIGRDSFRLLLKENGLLFKPRPGRSFVRTTDSRHRFRLYPNLLCTTKVTTPEQVWVADTTYLRIQGSHYFLALVCDAYSRKIMGWALQEKNTGELTCEALRNAYNNRIYPHNRLTHHSDRGFQYCCTAYRMLLYKMNMQVSTTESGDPRENAIMERTIRTLKYDFGINTNFSCLQQATSTIEHAVEVYNHRRIHFACKFNTPAVQHLNVKSVPILV